MRAGEVLEGGWIAISWMTSGDKITYLMAAKDEDGIGVLAVWELRDGDWSCWAVDTEAGEPVTRHDEDDGDCVPLVPPQSVT